MNIFLHFCTKHKYLSLELLYTLLSFASGSFLVWIWSRKSIASLEASKKAGDIYMQTWKDEALVKQRNLEEKLQLLQSEKERILQENASYQATLLQLKQQLENQKEEVSKLNENFKHQFEQLAQEIFEKNATKITNANQENINQILQPLKEKIVDFEKKVGETHEHFIKGHAELGIHLKQLNEQNLKIADEAKSLTEALRGDSKAQGNWGELVLERVLEKSGLTKGREYEVQERLTNEEGKTQLPDVVIHLPNQKKMIIDSKVSLRAYEKYVNATDDASKNQYLKQHILAIQNHVKQLSAKKYEDLHNAQSPDFVLLFIPIEPALYAAQSHDPHFFLTAFQQNILLVSPTTLLATLRTVDMLWNNEKQHQNAQDIAKHAGNLYDKFANLISELNTLGSRIDSVQTKYGETMKKLTGKQNLIKDIQELKKLGVSTKKEIQSSK